MATKTEQVTQYWWVTANEKNRNHPWHWERFFQGVNEDFDFGGSDCVKSRLSLARIKNMRAGDIVVAYQANEGIVGLAYLSSDGYQDDDDGVYNDFNLAPTPIVWLTKPIPLKVVRRLPDAKKHVEFVKISRGTVTSISRKGFDMILKSILRLNAQVKSRIHKFLASDLFVREAEVIANDSFDVQKPTHKITSSFQRVIRDSVVGKSLKNLYKYNCQVCGCTIETRSGKLYSEVHHLRPVGRPHNGKDGKPNTIVVCPQHHAMFDLGIIAINPSTSKIEHWNPNAIEHGISFCLKHELDRNSLRYHYTKIFKPMK